MHESVIVCSGPGALNTDLAVLKRFRPFPAERLGTLEFRGEDFNLLNFVNLGQPNGTMTSPAFGTITSAAAARVFQLGLRYDF
jgi:hypothetical protein